MHFSVSYWGFEIGLLAKGKKNRIRHSLREVMKKMFVPTRHEFYKDKQVFCTGAGLLLLLLFVCVCFAHVYDGHILLVLKNRVLVASEKEGEE